MTFIAVPHLTITAHFLQKYFVDALLSPSYKVTLSAFKKWPYKRGGLS